MDEKLMKKLLYLKQKKHAIIMAHYYTSRDVQELADYVGDSFYLAKAATQNDAKTIVFCGVGFMGESVKILNPRKTVLVPDMTADCPMAHMVSLQKLKELRKQYEDLAVVCYINSTAELKCLSDVCVTSSNALKIVKALPNQNIFFIPDQNLGRFVASKVPEKNVILNDGYCPIHASVTLAQLLEKKKLHPNALVLTHPECGEDIITHSDYVGSTAELISFAEQNSAKEYIICTENGIAYPLQIRTNDKNFYFVNENVCCADMKLNTPEKILHVLETGENEVLLDEETIARARIPLNKMLEMTR